MEISSLGIHVTDHCNASCQHCVYYCGPKIKGVMGLDDASKYLHQIKSRPEVVCISGGEPLLYFDLVLSIMQEAKALHIPSVWVFTNGYWAIDSGHARSRLKTLKEAGLTRLCLSADAFHQAFIPVERVRNALSTARDLGLEIALDVRFLGSLHDDNQTNRTTWKVLEQLGTLEDIEVWQGEPLYIGRAADCLPPQIVQGQGIPHGDCPGPWAGGTWEDPVGIDVDLYGEVTLCPGISIGNAKRRPLDIILAEYSPRDHPIIRELATGGPMALAKTAQRKGYTLKSSYVSECHLCYDVRQFLRPKYLSELAPRICYGEHNSQVDN